jgi:hypothetical protein
MLWEVWIKKNDIINDIKGSEQSQEIITQEVPVVPMIEEKTENELIDLTLKKNDKIEEQADKIIDLFFDGLERGTDRTHSSKEQMLEALKVKLEINKTIVEMAKIKKKGNASVGVLINTVPQQQTGINLDNIRKAME